MTQPREHCGELAPTVSLIGEGKSSTECVLRPGHSGSHATDNGMRWWLTTPAPTVLRDRYAAAIYEYNNPGHRWADAHPDDLICYGADADAALAVRDRELEQLRERAQQAEDLLRVAHETSNRSEAERASAVRRAEQAEQRRDELAATLHHVLGHFTRKGHPGAPCLESGWVREDTVAKWRAVLYAPATEVQS